MKAVAKKAVAKLGLAAVPPTGAALFFLRPYRWFWRALSVTAVGVATTAGARRHVLSVLAIR